MELKQKDVNTKLIGETQDGLMLFAGQCEYVMDVCLMIAFDGTQIHECREYKRNEKAGFAGIPNFSFLNDGEELGYKDYSQINARYFTTIEERNACIAEFIANRNHF